MVSRSIKTKTTLQQIQQNKKTDETLLRNALTCPILFILLTTGGIHKETFYHIYPLKCNISFKEAI